MSVSYFDHKRKDLIDILMKSGIRDERVLGAFNKVKREFYVVPEFKRLAYDNSALPISNNQTISQPFTVAFMTQLLNVKEGDKILEIGTGSGYQAAILCEMKAKVYSVERIEQLYEEAKKILHSQHYKVHLKCSDGTTGWEEHAPYDGIVVTAGSPDLPDSLVKQLATGGRLVIPIGDKNAQEIWQVIRVKDKDGSEYLDIYKHKNFKFVPLIGKEGW
ncbi:MAG: protein-L-isoaspartate(D-aspartate) O-methyltransferase [Ignavibacteriota bacterium]|nr:protein-L-isoaspartate(D-aspartate) O-methyltransferase [Ignavibacteriota bacterium]